jgi:hypothetical protein
MIRQKVLTFNAATAIFMVEAFASEDAGHVLGTDSSAPQAVIPGRDVDPLNRTFP